MSEIEENLRRWEAAAHAVQSGVATEIARNISQSHTPKHLRVGVNTALVDHGSIVRLLIEKGVFTEEEYTKAAAEGMEEEKRRYEEKLSKDLGVKITLA